MKIIYLRNQIKIMDIVSIFASKEFEVFINAFFGATYLTLGIFALWLIFKLLGYLKKKREVSIVSFLLNPQETLKEIKLIFYGCLIFFIGSIFGPPSFILGFRVVEPISLAFSAIFGSIVLIASAIYAILMVYIFFKWLRRFGKYD
jgi:hypothetical protein